MVSTTTYDPAKRRAEYLKYRDKIRESRKVWYREHKKEQDERTRRWRVENPERQIELQTRWYRENRERHLESSRIWAANHLALKAIYRRARRSMERNSPGSHTLVQLEARMAYYGYKCVYCGKGFEEVDHAIPLSRGGSNWPANLVPSCRSCNRRKHTKTWKEFLT